MSDYTPTTEEVRQLYVDATRELLARDMYLDEIQAEFDRWLAERDRKVKAKAWEEGVRAGENNLRVRQNPGTITPYELNPYRHGENK